MARATRSTTNLTVVDGLNNNLNKKRKRNKVEDAEDNHNQNSNTDPEDNLNPSKRHASESSIAANDAAIGRDELVHHPAILNVLEMVDTQGLLDREFPVLDHPGFSLSLRSLLQEPRQLSVLRAAVEHLTPLSSIPRAIPSPTAAQQRRFCDLALSLLEQAAAKTTPIPLSLSAILPTNSEDKPTAPRQLKYALVQHLPTGDYWTSLNSDASLSDVVAHLPTAQAELVAILPTPPQTSNKPIPTLSTYSSKQPLTTKPLPTHRTVTAASFLDYGPYSSFAPSFDHNGQVVGREELGEVLYSRARKAPEQTQSPVIDPEIEEISASAKELATQVRTVDEENVDIALAELFPADDATTIKAALQTYELERAVQELLERSRKALVELELMQITRLAHEGENSGAKEGSAEWDTAQGIMETLTILASLRPRASTSSSSNENPLSILPTPAILHKLHRTLAVQPTHGWYGTLPPTRTTALVDNSTVKKSRSVPTPVPAASTPTPAPATGAAATSTAPVTMSQPMTVPYSTYYAQAQAAHAQASATPYRPQPNGTAAPAATTTPYTGYGTQYYPHYASQQAHHQSYYGQQQQGYAAAAAHAYAGWYPYHHPQQAGAAGSTTGYGAYPPQQPQAGGSGRGTPVPPAQPQAASQLPQTATAPATAPTGVAPGMYGSYFGTTPLGQTNGTVGSSAVARTPAVANTAVTSGPSYATGAGVTLPTHLRAGIGQVQPGYYGAHQTQPQPTASMSPPAGQS